MSVPRTGRRRILQTVGFGILAAAAGCANSGSERTSPLPTLTGVFVTNRDPEPVSVRVVIRRDETVIHETTLDVEAYEPEGKRSGNAVVRPSEFEQEPGRWIVEASLESSGRSETFVLADSVPGGDAYAAVIRIEDGEIVFGHGHGFFDTSTTAE